MVSSSELHGLGAVDGPHVSFTWTPPSPLPRLLPWLVLLGLLTLKSNRTACAWWIWLPVLAVLGLNQAGRPLFGFMPSEALDVVGFSLEALSFGLASVWLLAECFHQRLRFLIALQMFAVMAGIGALSFLVRLDWENPIEAAGFLVLLGAGALVSATGLGLAGWAVRGRYRPAGLTLWLAVMGAGLWLVIVSPFFLLAQLGGAHAEWLELVQAVLVLAGLTLAVVLPFLVLSFANRFYRKRLGRLLRLDAWPEVGSVATCSLPEARSLEAK